jgi:hypothetical protein
MQRLSFRPDTPNGVVKQDGRLIAQCPILDLGYPSEAVVCLLVDLDGDPPRSHVATL